MTSTLTVKTELMSLLCRYSGEVADATYIRSLNTALQKSRNEVESLSIKLSKAEQQVMVKWYINGSAAASTVFVTRPGKTSTLVRLYVQCSVTFHCSMVATLELHYTCH